MRRKITTHFWLEKDREPISIVYEKAEDFGWKVKKLRKEKKLTIAEFSDKILWTENSIQEWENGTSFPDCSGLMKIANFFNVSPGYLLGTEEESFEQLSLF